MPDLLPFDFTKLFTEVTDLQNAVTAQVAARAELNAATIAAADMTATNAKKLADLQGQIDADQKKVDDALQAATVASQVADGLVVKQMNYLSKLVLQQDAGDDPTPDAASSKPKVTPVDPTPAAG